MLLLVLTRTWPLQIDSVWDFQNQSVSFYIDKKKGATAESGPFSETMRPAVAKETVMDAAVGAGLGEQLACIQLLLATYSVGKKLNVS